MSLRGIFILMLLFLGLGFWASYDYFVGQEKESAREAVAKRVLPLQGELLRRLTLESAQGRFEFECLDSNGCVFDASAHWRLVQPVQVEGDESNLASLTSSLLNLEYSTDFPLEPKAELSEYGLDKPRATVVISTVKGKEPIRIEYGKASAIGRDAFYKVAGTEKIFVAPAFVGDEMLHDLFYWRSKRMFRRLDPEQVDALYWYRSPPLELERKSGYWKLARPVAANANSIMAEGLVSTAVFAAAKSVYADAPEQAKIAAVLAKKPIRELRLTLKDKSVLRLSMYAVPQAKVGTNEFVARVNEEKELYIVDSVPFARFDKDILYYRERTLLPSELKDQISEITLRFPKEKKEITLNQVTGAWVYSAGEKNQEPLSQERISAFVSSLTTMEAQDFPHDPKLVALHARSQPDVELVLNAPRPYTFHFVIHERRKALVESDLKDEVREFSEKFLRLLPVRFTDLYAVNNKQVVIPSEEKHDSDHDGHEH